MTSSRQRWLIHGQRGSTLIELLVAMPIAVVLLGLVVQSLGQAGHDQQDIERRTELLTDAQLGLERMTRELRQATWVRFQSSSVVDINVRVRASSSSDGVYKLVRFDCSGEVCLRQEGPPAAYPPPASPSFTKSTIAIGAPAEDNGLRRGQIVGHNIFRPTRLDPATGATTVDYLQPDFLMIRLRLQIERLRGGEPRLVTIEDGISLRNRTGFAE